MTVQSPPLQLIVYRIILHDHPERLEKPNRLSGTSRPTNTYTTPRQPR